MLSAALVLFAATALADVGLPPIPDDLTTPVHQRLSMIGSTAMVVAWNTYEHLAQACVTYGASADALNTTVCTSSSVTYPTSRTWSNTVKLSGLQPATTYSYRINSTNSTVGEFMTGRPAGDTTSFTATVVADLGVYGEGGYTISDASQKREIPSIPPSLNHTTIASLVSTQSSYEFIIHPGDLAYADDWQETWEDWADGTGAYEGIVERFYDQLSYVSGRTPYQVSPGNHEADCSEVTPLLCPMGQRNFSDFGNRFGRNMPTVTPSNSSNATLVTLRQRAAGLALPPFWYSFDYGMAHIVMFDTETDFANAPDQSVTSLDVGPFGYSGQQTDFLKADLASVDRTLTPWVIAAGHRPWYTAGSDAGCTSCQTAFEQILYNGNVDLAIFGHVHNSQRFDPVYNGTTDPAKLNNPRAPMYIVAGGAGNIEGLSAITPAPSYSMPFAYNSDFSYSTLTFVDKNHLKVNFIRSSDSSVLDTSTLFKRH